eukprot:6212092-Pleurochrysis_carterae.AAC.4
MHMCMVALVSENVCSDAQARGHACEWARACEGGARAATIAFKLLRELKRAELRGHERERALGEARRRKDLWSVLAQVFLMSVEVVARVCCCIGKSISSVAVQTVVNMDFAAVSRLRDSS